MRTLVVDDSAFQRMQIGEALASLPSVKSVDAASSGEEAIRKLLSGAFDLVTLDVEMPGIDGLAVLRWVMANRPMPVLVISSLRGERLAIQALELGACDVVSKPAARDGMDAFRARLAVAVAEAGEARADLLARRGVPAPERKPTPQPGGASDQRMSSRTVSAPVPSSGLAIVIAASTGGPSALRDLLTGLAPIRQSLVFVAMAQHMPAPFTTSLAARLSATTGWDVVEPGPGTEAVAGGAWLCPGGFHLAIARVGNRSVATLMADASQYRWTPSGDHLFASAAAHFGARAIAIVLTGMGDDGAEGAFAISSAGGSVFAEGVETAVIPGMPDAASRRVKTTIRLPLPDLARAVCERVSSLETGL